MTTVDCQHMYHREGQHFIQGEEINVLVVGNMVVEGKGEEEEGDGEKEEGENGQLWMGTGVS